MNRLLAVAVVLFGCALPATAAQVTYLHDFSSDADHGLGPQGGVAVAGGRIFGTTGSNSAGGTIFSLSIDGSDYQMLHEFPVDGTLGLSPEGTSPVGKPIVVGDSIFGVNNAGFLPNNAGTIWAIDVDGTDFRVLHSFGSGSQGGAPLEGMNFLNNRLYGTTLFGGGGPNSGVLYSLNVDGSDYRVLHNFTGGAAGKHPAAAPIQVGARLFGTSGGGGADDGGIVYSINPDGTDFQVVHEFPYGYTATAGVVAVGNRLYGATTGGGDLDYGTVYSVNADGTDFGILHSFNGIDGVQASRDVTTDGVRLYGTTFFGVAYSVGLDGSGFEVLQNFDGGDDDDDETDPYGPNSLIISGSTLYGTTQGGGLYRGGTVFSITVPEPSMLALGVIGIIGVCVVSFFRIWFLQGRQDDENSIHGHAIAEAKGSHCKRRNRDSRKEIYPP